MFLSVFDVFKVGIGLSSSHTMGPMTAAADFLDLLRRCPSRAAARAVRATLYGSLAFTRRGHATDRAAPELRPRQGHKRTRPSEHGQVQPAMTTGIVAGRYRSGPTGLRRGRVRPGPPRR